MIGEYKGMKRKYVWQRKDEEVGEDEVEELDGVGR